MTLSIHQARISFLGAGTMTEALITGLMRHGEVAARSLYVTDVREERVAFFRVAHGVEGASGNAEAVRRANVVVLAVKPQNLDDVLEIIKIAVKPEHLIVSIIAGVTTRRIEAALGENIRVVRAMPNTPALIGAGVAAICRGRHATDADLDLAQALLAASGSVVRVEEKNMDAITAVSGSGPAYVFYLMEAMREAAKRMGLDDEIVDEIIPATALGAARMVIETEEPPEELRARVTSKGGTTAAAIQAMNDHKVFDALVEAVLAAQRRSKELSGGA